MLAKNSQDQYTRVGTIKTRFWALGDKGTPVILIHGLGGSVESWMFNVSTLAQHHRIYAIDLPGFGHTEKPLDPFSLSSLAQFVNDFMKLQGVDKASLIGNSMGGGITLKFAITFPEKIDRLVVVNSIALGTELSRNLRLASLPLIGEFFTKPGKRGTVRSLLEGCVYDPTVITEELVDISYQFITQPGAQKHFLSTLRSITNLRGQHSHIIHSIVDNLHMITAPTFIIWGKQDHMIPVAHAQVIKEGIMNSKLHILDSCGHNPQIEYPEKFNSLVLEFLAK